MGNFDVNVNGNMQVIVANGEYMYGAPFYYLIHVYRYP